MALYISIVMSDMPQSIYFGKSKLIGSSNAQDFFAFLSVEKLTFVI